MELKRKIKELILETLDIRDVAPADMDDAAPLFANSLLALDSLDAAELAVALQASYGVRIDNQELARAVLHSVDSIADFVRANQPQAA
jgi:acyl carrier protein